MDELVIFQQRSPSFIGYGGLSHFAQILYVLPIIYESMSEFEKLNKGNPTSASVREAAQWMARMAATDGVVTPSERLLLKKFCESYGIAANSILRMAHAIVNKVEIPEVEFISQSEMKGRKFEEFVVHLASDSSRFTLLNWSSDKYVDGVCSLDSLMPDLYLRHQLDSELWNIMWNANIGLHCLTVLLISLPNWLVTGV